MDYLNVRCATGLLVLAVSDLAAGCIGPEGAKCPCNCESSSPSSAGSPSLKPTAAKETLPVPIWLCRPAR